MFRAAALIACMVVVAGNMPLIAADENRTTTADLERELNQLLAERVESARLCVATVEAAYNAETITLDVLIAAINNLLEAELALAVNADAEIRCRADQVERLKQIEKKTELLYNIGAKGGEAKDYAQIKTARLNAEIDLLKLRIRAKKGAKT